MVQFTITITGEGRELTDALKAVNEAVNEAVSDKEVKQGEVTVVAEDKPMRNTKPKPETKVEQVEADVTGLDENEVDGGAEVVEISDVELRKQASAVSKKGKKDEVKALVEEFGVPNLTAIPQADRGAFLKRLEAL